MPFDFVVPEADEIETEEQSPTQTGVVLRAPQRDATDAVIDEINEQPDTQMSEVQRRLAIAQYCDLILRNDLFGNDRNPAAIEVQNRIRKFLRHELEVMVGIKTEQPVVVAKSDFNDKEIAVLKALAGKVLNKPSLLDPYTTKPPALHKIEQKPVPVAKPQLQPVRTQAAPQPPAAAPVKRGPGRPPKVTESIGPNGERIVKEGSKTYKIINVDGKEVRMDITKPSRGANPVPMPQNTQQLAVMLEQKAQEQDMTVRSANPLLQLAISESLKS